MMTANQYYKFSDTNLPFKEWLKREQLKGNLDIHENKFLNADGNDQGEEDTQILVETETPCYRVTRVARRRSFILGLALGYAICVLIKNKK